jgi:hypothetical protein
MHGYGFWVSEKVRFIFRERASDENSNVFANCVVPWHPGALKCLEGAFQKQALLRVKTYSLLLCEAKKWCVE